MHQHVRACSQHLQVAVEHAEGGRHGPDEGWHRFTAPLHPGVCEAAPGVVHQEHGKEERLIRTDSFLRSLSQDAAFALAELHKHFRV